jgi:hypothetical protein
MNVVAPSDVVTFLFTDIEGSTRRWEADAAGYGPRLPPTINSWWTVEAHGVGCSSTPATAMLCGVRFATLGRRRRRP